MIKKTIGYIILGLLGSCLGGLWTWLTIDSIKNPNLFHSGLVIIFNFFGLLYLGFYLISDNND